MESSVIPHEGQKDEGDGEEVKVVRKRARNDIKDIRSYAMLEKVNLELDSPRFAEACNTLGIHPRECAKKYVLLF